MKVMIVAGADTDNLTKLFNDRGTIQVTHSFPSLHKHKKRILEDYISVDKLIYVQRRNSMDIRRDMYVLQDLLRDVVNNRGFFKCREVEFFYIHDPDSTDDPLKFAKAVEKETRFEGFIFHGNSEELPFDVIFKTLCGQTTDNKIKNTKKAIIRAKRDSKVKRVFELEDGSRNEYVEPWTDDNIVDYDKAKELAEKHDKDSRYSDDKDTNGIYEKRDNPNLAGYDVQSILEDKNIFIFSGESKSGVSLNTAMLTTSAIACNKTVTLLNFTEENDTRDYIRGLEQAFSSMSLKMLMSVDQLEHKYRLNIININYTYTDIRLDALRYIMENLSKFTSDLIFIECPKEILDALTGTVGFHANRIFYSVETLDKEIHKVYNYVNSLSDRLKLVLLLSNNLKTINFGNKTSLNKRMGTAEIKGLFSKDITIIEPIAYWGVDDYYFSKLSEV